MASGNVRERRTKKGIVYQITIENGVDPITGERIREYKTFKGTRRQAEAEKDRLVAAVSGGSYVVNQSPVKLSSWMYQWLSLIKLLSTPPLLTLMISTASQSRSTYKISSN